MHMAARASLLCAVSIQLALQLVFSGKKSSTWIKSDTPIVPGVPYGWKAYAPAVKAELHFDKRGYEYCSNGQGRFGWKTLNKAIEVLKWRRPGRVFTQNDTKACLKNMWLHMDGDSLSRDQYYDVLELLGAQAPCSRAKTHEDQHIYITELNTFVSFGFNKATRSKCAPPTWKAFASTNWPSPNITVWSPGLWFNDKTDDAKTFQERLACVGKHSIPTARNVYRDSTPYTPRTVRDQCALLNELHRYQNMWAHDILVKTHGFQWLNAWDMIEGRFANLTVDGVHVTGPGSKWITNRLLQLVCDDHPLQDAPHWEVNDECTFDLCNNLPLTLKKKKHKHRKKKKLKRRAGRRLAMTETLNCVTRPRKNLHLAPL